MKINLKKLLLAYIFTFLVCSTFFLVCISECEAYYMHDDSIEITHKWLLLNCSYLFLIPTILLILTSVLQIETLIRLFTIHFFISLSAILLLTITIYRPCESINGGHYMFINFLMTAGYYLLRLVSFMVLFYIIIRMVSSILTFKH